MNKRDHLYVTMVAMLTSAFLIHTNPELQAWGCGVITAALGSWIGTGFTNGGNNR